MSVTKTTTRWAYVGDGTTTTFAYDNIIFATTDMNVYEDGTLKTSGYSVTGAGSEDGGNVVFDVAPTLGVDVVLVRSVPYLQPTEYPENDDFPASSHERALDRLCVQGQQTVKQTERVLRLSEADPTESIGNLPSKTDRASKVLSFDVNGDPETVIASEDIESASTYAAAAEASKIAAETAQDDAETAQEAAEAAQTAAETAAATINLPAVGAGTAGKAIKVNSGETGYEHYTPVLLDASQAWDATKAQTLSGTKDADSLDALTDDTYTIEIGVFAVLDADVDGTIVAPTSGYGLARLHIYNNGTRSLTLSGFQSEAMNGNTLSGTDTKIDTLVVERASVNGSDIIYHWIENRA